jgi:hypothetical protein
LLLHAFAYALQVKAPWRPIEGGQASPWRTRHRLPGRQLPSRAKGASLPPGTALTREWNSRRHVVLVEANGFRYQDATYASLTAVARAITGTHWSGRKFFKLDKKVPREMMA